MQYYDNFKRTTLKEGPPKLTWYLALLWKPLVGDLHTSKWTRGEYYAKYVTLKLRYNKHEQQKKKNDHSQKLNQPDFFK